MSVATPDPSTRIHIIDINVQLPHSSKKTIQSVDAYIDGEKMTGVSQRRGEGEKQLRMTLNPQRVLSTSQNLTLHVHHTYGVLSRRKSQPITISGQELFNTLPLGQDRREWQHSYGKTTVILRLAFNQLMAGETLSNVETGSLRPLTEDILRECPRFRILVIGKTGVGKSSLINAAFGITGAMVSDDDPGEADINKELLSATNEEFVLHDSKGFEHGEEDNVRIVRDFINKRSREPHIKNKLHAVWLCFDIPTAGGRVLETGVEDFLTMKTDGRLGDVPIIGVFTKYDVLVTREKRVMDSSSRTGLNREDITKMAEEAANTKIQKESIKPFEECAKGEIPYVIVSTDPSYKERLRQLIQVTYDSVYKYIQEASIVTAIAQKVNPGVNIDASIAVGKRKYWTGLATSAQFPGHTLQACLHVLHTDIVAVWHFKDPNQHLNSDQFKAIMIGIVDSDKLHANKILVGGLGMVASLAGILAALSGPAAPIVVPIAAGFVIAAWVHEVYKQSGKTLQRLMTYIVDLTIVMQTIFWLQIALKVENKPLSRRLIKLALQKHRCSGETDKLHAQIQKYVQGSGVMDRLGPDNTFNVIVDLINSQRINPDEIVEWEHQLEGKFILTEEDEPWDVPNGN